MEFMNFFKNKIVGVDFHDYSAEMVEISIKGDKKYLEAYSRATIPQDVIVDGEIKKPEELKTILKAMFQNANPHPIETKILAITFPSSKVITHIFAFPEGLSQNEIKKAISYEAETIIPFSINDIYWDFTILEKKNLFKDRSYQFVLFACINKQIADQYCNLFEEIETSPVLFSVTPDALRYSVPQNVLVDKTSLIIDVDTLAVNYLILENFTIKHFFSANEGGRKITTDISRETRTTESTIVDLKEKNKLGTLNVNDKIKNYIDRNYKRGVKIIEEYEAMVPGRKVEQVLLTGKFANLPDYLKMARDYFKSRQVMMGDPKLGLIIEPEKFNLEEVDKNEYIPYSIYFNNAIGSALRGLQTPYSDGINLLPDKLKESLDTREKSITMGISAVAMTLLTLATGTYLTMHLQNVNYEKSHLNAQKSAIDKMIYGTRYQDIKTEISTFNNEVNELSRIDNSLFSVPTTIRQIYALMPNGIDITSFTFLDRDISFEISGIADERTTLLEAQNNLKKAEFVESVIAPISNYDVKNKIPFQIKVKLAFNKLTKYGTNPATK